MDARDVLQRCPHAQVELDKRGAGQIGDALFHEALPRVCTNFSCPVYTLKKQRKFTADHEVDLKTSLQVPQGGNCNIIIIEVLRSNLWPKFRRIARNTKTNC